MALTPTNAVVIAKLAKQFGRGSWTDDPDDPNYRHHWNMVEPSPGETTQQVYAATARPTAGLLSPKNMATVRVTDEALYVDTPSVERVGLLGSLAGGLLDRSGASAPRRIPLSEVQMTPGSQPNRLDIQAPGVQVTARTDQAIGRPADRSAGDQLRRLASLFRS
jgi:hypothetical protein